MFAAPFANRTSHVRWSIVFAQGMVISLIGGLLLIASGFTNAGRLGFGALAVLSFAGGIPVAYYTTQIFPEVLMGGMLALSLLTANRQKRGLRYTGYLLMFACLLGNPRVLVGIAATSLFYLQRDIRRRDWLGAGVLIGAGASYLGYNLWLWGHIVPPVPPDPSSPLTLSFFPYGLLIHFLSNEVGLLFLNPAVFTGLAALVLIIAYCRKEPETWPTVLLIAGVIGVIAVFPNYRGGTCPAGRYQVVPAFLLLIPVLLFLSRADKSSAWLSRLKISLVVLGLLALLISLIVLHDPRSWFERYNPWFRWKAVQPYYYLLPSARGNWGIQCLAWTAFFLVTLFLADILRLWRRQSVKAE